jgi:hypothetical protein
MSFQQILPFSQNNQQQQLTNNTSIFQNNQQSKNTQPMTTGNIFQNQQLNNNQQLSQQQSMFNQPQQQSMFNQPQQQSMFNQPQQQSMFNQPQPQQQSMFNQQSQQQPNTNIFQTQQPLNNQQSINSDGRSLFRGQKLDTLLKQDLFTALSMSVQTDPNEFNKLTKAEIVQRLDRLGYKSSLDLPNFNHLSKRASRNSTQTTEEQQNKKLVKRNLAYFLLALDGPVKYNNWSMQMLVNELSKRGYNPQNLPDINTIATGAQNTPFTGSLLQTFQPIQLTSTSPSNKSNQQVSQQQLLSPNNSLQQTTNNLSNMSLNATSALSPSRQKVTSPKLISLTGNQ